MRRTSYDPSVLHKHVAPDKCKGFGAAGYTFGKTFGAPGGMANTPAFTSQHTVFRLRLAAHPCMSATTKCWKNRHGTVEDASGRMALHGLVADGVSAWGFD